jgi:hypothetical protein
MAWRRETEALVEMQVGGEAAADVRDALGEGDEKRLLRSLHLDVAARRFGPRGARAASHALVQAVDRVDSFGRTLGDGGAGRRLRAHAHSFLYPPQAQLNPL